MDVTCESQNIDIVLEQLIVLELLILCSPKSVSTGSDNLCMSVINCAAEKYATDVIMYISTARG